MKEYGGREREGRGEEGERDRKGRVRSDVMKG